MKKIIKFLPVFMLLIINNSYSQQIMKTVNDAEKIKSNEQLFVNKPLKTLLKEIGPEIKMVTANPSKSSNSRLGYFTFRFVDTKKYDSCRQKNKYPKQITVFVKESFEWDVNSSKKSKWTNSDLVKYGELTVVGIRVFGESINY